MSVVVIVGVQWGDEGKGKIVDYLTESADYVVRFQGGDNAGHTVIIDGEKTALRLIPSGIMRKSTRCLIAAGVVLNPSSLLSEIESLEKVGISVSPARLGIANEVHLIFPYHLLIDRERESMLAETKIGTTGKGIGPAYEDSVSRLGLRLGDLIHGDCDGLIRRNVKMKNSYLRDVLKSSSQCDADEVIAATKTVIERLRPYATDVSVEVAKAIEAKKYLIFEGAQGSLLDSNHGTYPFVTSSNTLAGYACVSAGFGPRHVDLVLGICKAYCTRVGSGPFPTEDLGRDGELMRARGKEFGTVTGRPRRCGWFDAVAARKTVRLNGIDSLVMTKLDVLSGFETVKIGTHYSIAGESYEDVPPTCGLVDKITTKYEELEGWHQDLGAIRKYEELPESVRTFIRRTEELTNCEIGGVSIGPDRSQTIVKSPTLAKLMAIR